MKRLLLLIPLLFLCGDLHSAEYRTKNFTVTAADPALAKKVGDAAEYHRAKHAREWLGQELPNWYAPCPITVKAGPNLGNGGATTFSFSNGEVFGWRMDIQGTPQGLVDSTVPHEVLHTIFACKFRQSIPRWADEGAATYVEDESEKQRQRLLAAQVVGTQEQFPIRQLLNIREYPEDGRKLAVLYAQSFYLSEYLINKGGKPQFVQFLETYFKTKNWDTAFKVHYGFSNQEAAMAAAYQAHKQPAAELVSAEVTPFDYDNYHIDVFVQDNCGPCTDWKTKELPKFKDVPNLKFVLIDLSKSHNKEAGELDSITGTPAFAIYKNGHKVQTIVGYQTYDQLMKASGLADKDPEIVQANQGVGIGYFGPIGGGNNGNKPNPHSDFSAAQMQILQREIDSRAQVNIEGTITNRMADLEKLIDARIQNAVLVIQSKLTDEQKAAIGATDAQKAELASLKDKIAVVEAGKQKLKEETDAKIAELAKKDEEVSKQVEAAKVEAETQKSTIVEAAKSHALEAVKAHLPEKLTGFASIAGGAVDSLAKNGPWGLGLAALGWFISRRKEDEPTVKIDK